MKDDTISQMLLKTIFEATFTEFCNYFKIIMTDNLIMHNYEFKFFYKDYLIGMISMDMNTVADGQIDDIFKKIKNDYLIMLLTYFESSVKHLEVTNK